MSTPGFFDFLSFLASPWFVIPWYAVGIFAAAWVLRDTLTTNKSVNPPLKVGWPVIVIFFSVIGLGLYFWSCRPPGIGRYTGETEKKRHHEYVDTTWRKVLGSAIHCVGGDGLGIMTGMAIARIYDFSFWEEFWFEYAVGFLLGWLIFQMWSFLHMGSSVGEALWKGFRGEFFSMITVMLGMGAVMKFVTPSVMGSPPDPWQAAFWGFGALGLLVGFVVTYPMNWWLVKIGWKHGMM